MPSDTRYSLATAQSICRGTLSIAPTETLPYLSKGTRGKYYSKYGPGYALLFVPTAIIANFFSRYSGFDTFELHQILASFTNTFIAAMCLVVFLSIMKKVGFDRKIIICTGALIASCSLLLPYSKINHSELPATLLLLLFAIEWYDSGTLTLKKGLRLGFIMSALLLLKIGNAISAVVIAGSCVYCIVTRRSTKSGALMALFMPVLTVIFLIFLNLYRFGTCFNFGYGTEQKEFTTPILSGLIAFFISPSKSMLIFSPLLILSTIGFSTAFARNRRFHFTIIILVISNVLFYSCWHDWHGGWSWGPRLITPVIILMHIYLPFFFEKFRFQCRNLFQVIKNGIVIVLILCSLFINVLGSLIWCQQIYYFHRNYSSLNCSHPVIAYKLFIHKLRNEPEIYICSTFNRNCTQPPYISIWNSITQNGTISFRSFETFQGFSTFWGFLRARSESGLYLIVPFILFGFSLLFIIINLFLKQRLYNCNLGKNYISLESNQ
jgi:hypothetical protein